MSSQSKTSDSHDLKLVDGSQVAVIGGGPAGSFFSYCLLELANRVGVDIHVEVYEPRDFSRFGPAGCNHCGGIISESLVQILATEGINLPNTVVQRGLDSYVLHMDVGSVKIATPQHEKRIAAIHRGAGPLGTKEADWGSFDGFLQQLSKKRGAQIINDRVKGIRFNNGRPVVETKKGVTKTYDLIAGSVGLNTRAAKLFEELDFGYITPQSTKTFICEFHLGHEVVQKYFGNSMHVLLLDIPRLKFAALIPKGNHVTLCLLGEQIDKSFVSEFMDSSHVKKCFPAGINLSESFCCKCFPDIYIQTSTKPYTDRAVLIGDCAVSRLYKDGIGAAYSTARAAASTAIFEGISSKDFQEHYWPICKSINKDNTIGKIIFFITRQIQKREYAKHGVMQMVMKEQRKKGIPKRMSSVLWDTFTCSAPYCEIFRRTLHPSFLCVFTMESILGLRLFNLKSRGYSHGKE